MDPCAILSNMETIDIYVIKPVKPHIDRALRKRRYREALEKKVEDLAGEHQRLKNRVAGARRETREIDGQVDLWQTKVETRIAEARQILQKYERSAQQRCFFGLSPNFITRYQLNHKAEAEVTAVNELLGEAAGYGAVETISHLGPAIAESTIDVRDYESFHSREIIVQRVVDGLTVLGKSKVGVYGMGGSGKTTLAKVVAGKVTKKPFDFVVFCKVTAVPNIASIQEEIMEKLGLQIKEKTPAARAKRLLEMLEKMLQEKKKILFVLDDLWRKLELEAVGIPSPDQHKGCQILMTSRQRQVLSTGMGCDDNVIDIGLLLDDEAWKLFKKMSANNFENSDALRYKAHDVAKACAGLPIAIVTVARALKNKTDLPDWEAALLDLNKPFPSNFSKVKEDDPAIGEDVHKSIYLSYKLLASDELRSTLLLCSQLPSNSSIFELLRYSWSLRFLPENRMRKVEDAQNTLRSLVGQLQDSCLLLDTGSKERIALHDVVRVITKAIASEEHHVFTRSPEDDELTHWPADQNWTRMWLHCKVAQLPEKWGYPQLELFHMDNASTDLKVPDGIFKLEGRQSLKVLSLIGFSSPLSLPSSLESLKESLRTLCLDGSCLEDTKIGIIGELDNLEILSFAKCEIRRLPEEIGKLKKLKILDLSDCPNLEEVPRDVISRLSLLEELYMGNSFRGWETEGGAKASLAEVRMLNHLSNLEIVIPDASVMVENLFSKGLKRYRVTIGTDKWWDKSYETLSKLLRISLDTSIDFGFYGIQMLLSCAEVLCLGRMKGAKNMLSEGFPQLKHLKLEENFEIQYVVDATKSGPSKAFPALESLLLDNLGSLEEICHGEFRSKPFPRLAAIEVRKCHHLKNLFSFSISQGLSHLKSIEARECGSIEGIVGEEEEATDDKMEFFELRTMVLRELPQLKKFCYKMQEAPNSLFDEKIVFPKLEELELDAINMKTLWHGSFGAVTSFIQNLRRLSVERCHAQKYLFTSSMVGYLVQLEYLSVQECKEMEEIILTEEASIGEGGRIGENEIVFSKLDALYLWDLPKLERFCGGYQIKCPHLKKIRLWDCDALKTFVFNPSGCENKAVNAEQGHDEEDTEEKHQANARPLFDEKVCFPNLAELDINGMENVEKIWHDQLWDGSFCILRRMDIQNCKQLLNVFPSKILIRFRKLEQLKIQRCPALEEIFVFYPSRCENKANARPLFDEKVYFPSLAELEIKDMGNLRHIWKQDHPREMLTAFQNLRRLSVERCHAQKYLFTSSMVGCLVQLEFLSVKECKEMEEIILTEEASIGEGGRIGENEIVFSKLDALYLRDLPKLERLCGGYSIKCPYLKRISLWTCHALKTFVFNPSSCENKAVNVEQGHDEEDTEVKHQANVRPLFDEKVCFPSLAALEIREMENLEKIWHDQLGDGSFCTLRRMDIVDCQQLLNVFPSKILTRFRKLEQLKIERCRALEEIFDLQWPNVDGRHDVVDFQLRDITLVRLHNLRHIWKQDPLREMLTIFQNLQSVETSLCPLLKSIFPASIATDLMQLKTLKIRYCDRVEEIVAMEESVGDNLRFRFPNLSSLVLHKLPKLKHLHPGMHTSEFPILTQVDGGGQPEKQMQHPLLYRSGDTQLEKGEVVISATKGRQVWYCDSSFSLGSLSACFQSLTTLDVSYCDGLTYIMPPSTAKSLVQLKELSVRYCARVSEIVSQQDGKTEDDEITFSKLERLTLDGLENLTNFCSGGYTFIFPNLKEVMVQGCPRMRFFSSGHSRTPKLEGVGWKRSAKNKVEWKGDLNSTIQHLFKEMVEFDGIRQLKLSEFSEMREIWHGQLKAEFFRYLRSLTVDECQFSSIAVPSKLLPVLNDLTQLKVSSCSSLKGILDFENLKNDEGDDKKLLFELRELSLTDLPRLSYICNKDPQRTLEFKSLTILKIDKCSSLKSIFKPSMAMGLPALEEMEIRNCSAMQEIISAAETGEEAPVAKTTLRALKNIILESLPNLTGIYGGSDILEFPSLGGITIANCPKMNAFLSSILFDIPVEDSLLSNKVLIPGLKMLVVDLNNAIFMEEIANGQAARQFNSKIKVLEVMYSSDVRFAISTQLVRRFPNLDLLTVHDSFFKEMVLYEETNAKEEHTGVPIQLNRMKLSKLPNLKHLSLDESHKSLLFRTLKKLMVLECGGLKILAPSSVVFQCLTVLIVSNCHGLVHLVTCSTAKSMVQLRAMWISKCKKIREIFADKENEAGGEFNFSKLKCLILDDLPSLTSFCSGKYAFTFPILELVIVKDCPKLKTFCQGVSNTPKLKWLYFEADEGKIEEEFDRFCKKVFDEEFDEFGDYHVLKPQRPSSSDGIRGALLLWRYYYAKEDYYHWCWEGSLNATVGSLYKKMGQSRLSDSPRKQLLESETTQAENEKAVPQDKLLFSSTQPSSNFETAKAEKNTPLSAYEEPASEDWCAKENSGSNKDLHQEIKTTSQINDKDPTPGHSSSTPESLETHSLLLPQHDPQETSNNEPQKHQDNVRDSVPLAASTHSVSVLPLPQKLEKEIQEATPSDTQYGTSPLSHQSLLGDTEMPELHECTEGDGVQHAHSVDSQAVDAPLPSVVFPADAEVYKTGQIVPAATLKTLSKQPISNFDASQEGPTTPMNMGTDIPLEAQKHPHSTANIELPEHHDVPVSSNEKKGTVLESFVTAVEQAPATKSAPGTDTESSQELKSLKTETPSVSSDAADVRASTNKTTSSEGLKSVSSAEATSKKVAVKKSHTDFTMSFDNLLASMEHIIHSIPTSSSQLTSTSSTRAESRDSPDLDFDRFRDSISLIKQILRKNLAEVARSADSHLLLYTLKNLRKSPLLNPQQSELVQVFIDNFDSILMLNQFYEHQIDRANALKFSIEDEKKEVAELKTHNEDLNNKINCLGAEKEALMKRLGKIEEEEDHIRATKEGACGELVRKTGILEIHMEALPEALTQQREAEDKASRVNDLWAKIRSSFN